MAGIIDHLGEIQGPLEENRPEYVILHGTINHPTYDSVLRSHRARGFATVGYHLFIDAQGKIHQARPLDKEGAHALGFNFRSIGICCYQPDFHLPRKSVESVHEALGQVLSLYPQRIVVSHTLAQVMRINKLLGESGHEERFQERQEVTYPHVFAMYANIMTELADRFGKEHPPLEKALKSFKNCPGSTYPLMVGEVP
jgi:hypothetical protein